MKLATLNNGSPDGQLVVVSCDLSSYVAADDIALNLSTALENWQQCEPLLADRYLKLENGEIAEVEKFDSRQAMAPLPRSWCWADGSAYVTHVELVRKARGAELPESFWHDPLMYMGASDAFLAAHDDIPIEKEEWGIDFEAEVAVFTDQVAAGTSAAQARKHIRLLALVNDVSLRNLIPAELAKQFGFFQSKTWTSFSPVAVTPDELGDSWRDAKVHLPLIVRLNDRITGAPNAATDMTFDFGQLIAHAVKTRPASAGTVIGSGTVATVGSKDGSCCLAEVRALETIQFGSPRTEFMKFGDRVQITMRSASGISIFGDIDQRAVPYRPPTDAV